MRILIVMTGFFPGQKFGGPPVSVDNFCTLMKDYECFIVTRNHDMGDKTEYTNILPGWNDRGNCKVKYFTDDKYKKHGYRTFEDVICEIKPDAIYLQGLFQNCIIPCLMLAKKYKIKILLAPRGELNYGAFKKKYKKLPYITFLKVFRLTKTIHFQSTSDEETECIMKWLSIDKDRIHFLTNIPSIPKQEYTHRRKESEMARIVFLSRIHSKKNLLFAIDCLKRVEGQVIFDIYGPIEDEEYWTKCEREIKTLPSNVEVNYCGLVSHEEVHSTFSKYDAFLFPTYSENFGHVIAEALLAGCPCIISDQTPFSNLEKYNAGWTIPLSESDRYVNAINTIVKNDNIYQRKMIEGVSSFTKDFFDLNGLHDRYLQALLKISN
ncbi:MAG: glycosyltransferase [Lachnospiraceae bacterium]|nr:glycosyltransferase [Lachnospiraceae bacterium]